MRAGLISKLARVESAAELAHRAGCARCRGRYVVWSTDAPREDPRCPDCGTRRRVIEVRVRPAPCERH